MADVTDAVAVTDESLPLTARQRYLFEASKIKELWSPGGSSETAVRITPDLQKRKRTAQEAFPLVMTVEVEGELNSERLQRALLMTAVRHDALRTAFRTEPGYLLPRQSVVPPEVSTPLFCEFDLRGVENSRQRMEEHVREERGVPLDISRAQVLKVLLFRLTDHLAVLSLLASPLVADRRSLTLIYGDLVAAYSDRGGDRPEATGESLEQEEELGHAQFVEWRHELDSDEEASMGRGYWKGLALEALDAPRPACQLLDPLGEGGTEERMSVRRSFDPATVEGLSHCGVSRSVVLQAAWWLVLARASLDPDFVAGWQHDCRQDYDAFAEMAGALDEILPVAPRINENESLASTLKRLSAMLIEHREAQEFWTPEQARNCAIPSVGFAIQDLPPPLEGGGLSWVPRDLPGPSKLFEMVLDIGFKEGQPAEAELHYDAALYSEAAARRFLDHYMAALSLLPAHMASPIWEMPIACAADRTDALALNETSFTVEAGTLVERFAKTVDGHPDDTALWADGKAWTYAQLDAQVDLVARRLRQLGVEAETRVALVLPRSADLIIALWAVLRAGGCYVPLDPAWPAARREAILADATPSLVLTTRDVMPDPSAAETTVRYISDLMEESSAGQAGQSAPVALPDEISPRQAAYVLYTSGSTGRPKGVVVEHGHLANYVAAASAALDLTSCRRFALTSSVAADLGNTTLFGAFWNGGCLYLADEQTMMLGTEFVGFLRAREIDCLKIVPSHLAALLDLPAGEAGEAYLPATLVLGGEATPWALVDRIFKLRADCRVYNHYGPTETTVGVIVRKLDPRHGRQGPGPSLTQVLGNCKVYVLDKTRSIAPAGALGELYIGGAQVSRGYLGQPDASAFVEVPALPGERLYRTGDLARYLPEGGLQIIGREDEQVKIRGFRVEPAEIERVLATAPGVGQAAVKAWGEGDRLELAAYVVPQAGEAHCDLDAVKSHARAWLSDAMIPGRILTLDALPRLANGKIDRQALPEPAGEETQRPYVAPHDPVEATVAELVAELLERERVSVEESFFDLGGHSLLVIKLVARLRKVFQIEIEPGIVFDYPSVRALATALRAVETTPGRLEKVIALREQIAAMSEDERKGLLEQSRSMDDGKVA